MPNAHAVTAGADFRAPTTQRHFAPTIALLTIITLWFAIALIATLRGWFAPPPGSPPLGLVIALAIPVTIFLIAWTTSSWFRERSNAIDPLMLAAAQQYRIVGGVFLVFMILGQLPMAFAIPAGIGDVAIGLTALVIIRKIARDPAFTQTRAYRVVHYAGLSDFVLAFASGPLVTTYAQNTDSMHLLGSAPLALIPGFLVPIFAIGHLSALLQRKNA
jgi:hypothetical protein